MKDREFYLDILDATITQFKEHPETWTKDLFARNASGHYAHYNAPDAVKWCALGYMMKISGGSDNRNKLSGMSNIIASKCNKSIIGSNDSSPNVEVLVRRLQWIYNKLNPWWYRTYRFFVTLNQ